jgi:Ser/Thr protein kinase RdoA (MazF antagonist)
MTQSAQGLSAVPPDWTPIGKGISSEVFGLDGNRIAKIFRPEVSDDMIAREAHAATLAAARGIATAAPLERIMVGGRRTLLYPRISGQPMLRAMRRKPLSTPRLLDGMAALHGAIHDHRGSGLRRVKSVLETDILYGPAPAALQQQAVEYLATLEEGDALLHGDFHIENILVNDGRLAVIDWAKASMGAPAADLVRAEMLMRFGAGPSDAITNLWRDWAARRLVRAYRGDVTGAQLAAWRPVVALAWLRARPAVRDRAFRVYLNRALAAVRLPAMTGRSAEIDQIADQTR